MIHKTGFAIPLRIEDIVSLQQFGGEPGWTEFGPMNYCPTCGAPVWILKGGGVYTCKRGHHHPITGTPRNA